MREIAFRVWRKTNDPRMMDWETILMVGLKHFFVSPDDYELMQFTGLLDKKGLTCIYEGDIIGVDGIVRGNKYENSDLLRDKTNLIIQGFGTSSWEATNKEAVGRGCKYSE